MKSRTRARSLALQALYEVDVTNHPPAEVLKARLEEFSARRLAIAGAGRSGSSIVVVESGWDFQLHFRKRPLSDRAWVLVSVLAARAESEVTGGCRDGCPRWLWSVVRVAAD